MQQSMRQREEGLKKLEDGLLSRETKLKKLEEQLSERDELLSRKVQTAQAKWREEDEKRERAAFKFREEAEARERAWKDEDAARVLLHEQLARKMEELRLQELRQKEIAIRMREKELHLQQKMHLLVKLLPGQQRRCFLRPWSSKPVDSTHLCVLYPPHSNLQRSLPHSTDSLVTAPAAPLLWQCHTGDASRRGGPRPAGEFGW